MSRAQLPKTQFISLGNVTRTHGYKGAVVAISHLNKESALGYLNRVFIGPTQHTVVEYHILDAAWMPRGWKLSLQDVTTVESALKLQAQTVYAAREDLPKLAKGEYYVSDLHGFRGVDSALREITLMFKGVMDFSTEDGTVSQQSWIFETSCGREISVPAVKRYIQGVNYEKKEIALSNISDLSAVFE